MNKILMMLMLWICGFAFPSKGQDIGNVFTPKIGDTLPEYTFTDLRNCEKDQVSLSELRGKWLILDFWSKNCSGCLASFPKMNMLHEQFKDDITILMVGDVKDIRLTRRTIEQEKPTKELYESLEKRYDLKLIVSFDSLLHSLYGLRYLPYILIVDPDGIVRYITASVNEQVIFQLLKGREPLLRRVYNGLELDVIENQKEQSQLLSESQWMVSKDPHAIASQLSIFEQAEIPRSARLQMIDFDDRKLYSTRQALDSGYLAGVKYDLGGLFFAAYFGVSYFDYSNPYAYHNFSKKIIFETADSSIFLNGSNTLYTYQLKVPVERATPEFFKNIMQKDLEAYFGLKGRLDKRPMPVYNLIVKVPNKAEKLKTTGSSTRYSTDPKLPDRHQLIVNNKPIQSLCDRIRSNTQIQEPIIDRTGIEGNIDIDIHAYVYDFEEVKSVLLEVYGLALIEGTKEMETLIISDSDVFK